MKFSKWFQKNGLLIIVFITGACVLIIEILAFRILAPFFGNTIFTTSSVLAVILAALSIGYYYGGKYASKNTKSYFFSVFSKNILPSVVKLFKLL